VGKLTQDFPLVSSLNWKSRRTLLLIAYLSALSITAFAAAPSTQTTIVVQWNQAELQGVRDNTLGPPLVARALAIVHTCIYDAWSAYDNRAVGTRMGGDLRRPELRAHLGKHE
jgi:hypothetical protein